MTFFNILMFLMWTIFYCGFGVYFLLTAFRKNQPTITSTSFYYSHNIENRSPITGFISRIIRVALSCLFLFCAIPYLMDLPPLITYRIIYVEGYKHYAKVSTKGFQAGAEVNGKIIKFTFTSNMDNDKLYRVGYLPNTHTGIEVKGM